MIKAFNETEPMTRRIPSFITKKQAERDSKIAKKIIVAGDVHNNMEEILSLWNKYHSLLSNPRYWEILRTVWVMCGNRCNYDLFRKYFTSNRPAKGYFMTPEDKHTLESFLYPITVYRAAYRDNDNGMSWSTDKEWVEHYASLKDRKIISRVIIDKSEVFAYINRRGEHELIIL